LRETWESTTKEERDDLVHVMLQEVGVDVAAKRVLWVKARPDGERRHWIECLEAQEDNCDREADTGQASTGVEIMFQLSHNTLI